MSVTSGLAANGNTPGSVKCVRWGSAADLLDVELGQRLFHGWERESGVVWCCLLCHHTGRVNTIQSGPDRTFLRHADACS